MSGSAAKAIARRLETSGSATRRRPSFPNPKTPSRAYVDFLERPRPEVVPIDAEQNSDDRHFEDGVALAESLTEIGSAPNDAAEKLVESGLPFALRAVPLEGKPALRE